MDGEALPVVVLFASCLFSPVLLSFFSVLFSLLFLFLFSPLIFLFPLSLSLFVCFFFLFVDVCLRVSPCLSWLIGLKPFLAVSKMVWHIRDLAFLL